MNRLERRPSFNTFFHRLLEVAMTYLWKFLQPQESDCSSAQQEPSVAGVVFFYSQESDCSFSQRESSDVVCN